MTRALADETPIRESPPDSHPEPDGSKRPLGFFTQLALASHLDQEAYVEVARNSGSTWKIAVMLGLGGMALLWNRADSPGGAQALLSLGLAGAGWLAASSVTWVIALGIPSTRHAFPEVLRAVGFAGYPFLLFAIVASAGRGTPMLAPLLEAGVLAFAAFSLYTSMRRVVEAPANLSAMMALAALGAYMLPWIAFGVVAP